MKRYRLTQFDFDSRADLLDAINPKKRGVFSQAEKANCQGIVCSLRDEYGSELFERKLARFIAIGVRPASFLAFHNLFLIQIRNAYVVGASYPALTAACALGERILNHMILVLRDSYKSTEEYKNVYRKRSFDNWDIVIDTLASWDVLLNGVKQEFRELKELRNNSIHFNYDTEKYVERDSLKAVKLIQEIVLKQFSFQKALTEWIFMVPGEIYIKQGAENIPFVKEVVIPPLTKVGPQHELDKNLNPIDTTEYNDTSISDEEFHKLRKRHLSDKRRSS